MFKIRYLTLCEPLPPQNKKKLRKKITNINEKIKEKPVSPLRISLLT